MRHLIKYICAATMLCISTAATAQQTYSGYFTDNYLYRHDMNPAAGNSKGYFAFPALGNIDLSLKGNIGLDRLIFTRDGKTTTFLNPQVSTSEFLSGINDKNKIMGDVRLQILGFGFKGFGGYNTFEVNARADFGVCLPGDILRFAKEGISNSNYDIGGVGAHANAYAEVALGHSHQINDQLRIGVKYKVLLGFANIDAKLKKATLDLGEDQWQVTTDAEIQASLKGLTYETEETMRGPEGAQTRHTYVSGVDVDSPGMNGFGMAVDLGAEYRLNDDWKFSAALLDLGFISWKNNMLATTGGERHFTTDTYLFNVNDDADNSFENELDRMTEGLAALYELQDKGDQGGRTTSPGATLNLGAEYSLPSYRNLTFGLTSTTRINGDYSWTKFRLGANITPVKFISAGVNVGVGTCGTDLGWMLAFTPKGFSFFVGMDHILGNVTKQFVPLGSNCDVTLGFACPF